MPTQKVSETGFATDISPETTNLKKPDEKHIGYALEIWKKTIDVQQHFNTIEMQIRNFAVTILAGIIAAAALALREPKSATVFGITITIASLILIAGVIVLLAFYFMDRWWYHRLLQGAVEHAQMIENQLKEHIPALYLSNTIRKSSPFTILWIRFGSNRKIDAFYFAIIIFLLIAAYGLRE